MKPVAITEKRRSERSSLGLTAEVKVKENKENFWKETTDLISVSRSGAGFYLDRRCEVGQLVSLMTTLPRHLRCYDSEKELYRVFGLVQHCSAVQNGAGGYHVGVAFVGKDAPASYTQDPLQSYRICGINADGLWKIVEAERPFVTRRYPRFYENLEVMLAAFDDKDDIAAESASRTENVSLRGAAVFSDLDVNVGDCVRFTSEKYNFSTLAVVRNRQGGDDRFHRIHIEFISADFPIRELNFPVPPEKHDDEQ